MSSSQSEERTMVFTSEKKWYVQSQATKVCEFRAKNPPFIGACSLQRRFADIFLGEFFSWKKGKTSRKLEFVQKFVSLSMKKTVESRLDNSRREKQNDT